MSLFGELKRRNVFRVGIAYVVGGWLLLQLTDVLSELLDLPDVAGRIVVLIVAIGFPLALFFAWAFELTPEGIKREHEVDRSQSITSQTGRKLDFVIIGVLAVALAYFVADKFLLQPAAKRAVAEQASSSEAETGPRSIAVLPLVNMSADAENEYFSDGLTEELLNILAKIKELQVAGRTSSFAFKGKTEDLRGIAEKLNVESILEGSVRKDADRVRITVQLINAADGYHLWSETYDRELDDIFAIQEEIATEVARALRVTLLGEDVERIAHQPTTGLSAYDHYLKGLQQLNNYSYASLEEARASFGRAIELDPDYLPAQVRLAGTWMGLAGTGAVHVDEAIDQATPILRHVLGNEPDNDEAHAMMARVHRFASRTEPTRTEARRALDINPRNVTALLELGRSHTDVGEVARGIDLLKEAERIDPYSPLVLWHLTFAHAEILDIGQSTAYARRIGEIEPDSPNRYWGEAVAHLFSGNLAQALELQVKTYQVDPDDYEISSGIAGLWLDMGDIERAEHWQQIAEEIGAEEPATIKHRIHFFQYREQYDLAAELARQALEKDLDDRQGSGDAIRNAWVSRLYRAGRFDEALAIYREEYPEAFDIPPDYSIDEPWDVVPMIEIAFLLRAMDPKSEQADGFVDAVERLLDKVENRFLPGFTAQYRAGLAATRGDRQGAVEQMFHAYEAGLKLDWRDLYQEWFVLSDLQDEPEFKALIARIEEDMERQRGLAYELVGAGP